MKCTRATWTLKRGQQNVHAHVTYSARMPCAEAHSTHILGAGTRRMVYAGQAEAHAFTAWTHATKGKYVRARRVLMQT